MLCDLQGMLWMSVNFKCPHIQGVLATCKIYRLVSRHTCATKHLFIELLSRSTLQK